MTSLNFIVYRIPFMVQKIVLWRNRLIAILICRSHGLKLSRLRTESENKK